MSRHTYFAGLDFSGARGALSNLWSCVGVERDGRLHVLSLRPHAFRPDAADYLAGGWRSEVAATEDAPLLAGLDFPFSLPDAAARLMLGDEYTFVALNRHVAEHSPDEVVEAAPDHRKSPRACDTFFGGGSALAPLDLRVYKQTCEGARFLHELLSHRTTQVRPQAPREAATLTLIEVYPSVTASDVGIKAPRKPKAPGQHRSRPAALSHYLSFDHPALEAAAVTLEDAWDATLACLTAWLVRDDLDQPARVGTVAPEQVMREGWIYRHPDAWTALPGRRN
jgi:hypothetical protein